MRPYISGGFAAKVPAYVIIYRFGAHLWRHGEQIALVGAGSVVTKDVPAHVLVFGKPARQHCYVCPCPAVCQRCVRSRESCLVDVKLVDRA